MRTVMLAMYILLLNCSSLPQRQAAPTPAKELTDVDREVLSAVYRQLIVSDVRENLRGKDVIFAAIAKPYRPDYPDLELPNSLTAALVQRNALGGELGSWPQQIGLEAVTAAEFERRLFNLESGESKRRLFYSQFPKGVIGFSLPVYSSNGLDALTYYSRTLSMTDWNGQFRATISEATYVLLRREKSSWKVRSHRTLAID